VVPLGIAMVMFGWGAYLYLANARAPAGSNEIYVIAKQWMWKIQHPEGAREINELHVPTGVPIRLVMTSEDVIHSFYVPAFRIKQDVLPGATPRCGFSRPVPASTTSSAPNTAGLSTPGWSAGSTSWNRLSSSSGSAAARRAASMSEAGQALFERLGCSSCHTAAGGGRGTSLVGAFGKQVQLAGGQVVTADESYMRESILNPRAKIVAGYQPLMPTFQGQVSEEQVLQLLAYIKSLGKAEGAPAN